MKTLATLALLLAIASPAFADSGLYVNTDNKGWKLIRLFAFPEECDREARSLYRSGKVIGAGCADVGAIVDTRPSQPSQPQQQAPSIAQPDPPSSGTPYEQAKARAANKEKALLDRERRFNEEQRALEAERDRVRAFMGKRPCAASNDPGCGVIVPWSPPVPKDSYFTTPYGK